VQALQPFIDPATAKKVLFISKDNEAVQMPALFPMEKMEPCLGGSGTHIYNSEAYGSFCKGVEASRNSAALLQQQEGTPNSAQLQQEHAQQQKVQ